MHFFEAKRSSLVRQSSRFPSACPRVVPCGRDASYNRGYSFIGRKLVQLFSIVVLSIIVPSIIVSSIIVPPA
jgi:hypothetical protein